LGIREVGQRVRRSVLLPVPHQSADDAGENDRDPKDPADDRIWEGAADEHRDGNGEQDGKPKPPVSQKVQQLDECFDRVKKTCGHVYWSW